jgi:threonine/homoserine/homoserine lactone efflux protein
MDLGIRRGFRYALVAGAGAATADLVYAGLAFLGGSALAGGVQSIEGPLRVLSGVVLVLIAIFGLYRSRWEAPPAPALAGHPAMDLIRTYLRFVGLTIINPTTVVYFAAVIIGLGIADDMTPVQGLLFVTGAFLASLSWQTLIAGAGALAGSRLPARARIAMSVGGNLFVLVLGLLIILR